MSMFLSANRPAPYATIMTVLLVLFLGRVIGQVLAATMGPS